VVATIALGVCVDDTIHLLTKYASARRTGATVEDAIRSTFRQVGGALTWTSVTLALGFAVVAFSDFRPNMLVGALGAAMVALAWVADLLVAPALLSLTTKERVPALAARELEAAPAE
jgi:predicted RND superfamily exporter protein